MAYVCRMESPRAVIKWKVHAAESPKELEELLNRLESESPGIVHSIMDSKRLYLIITREPAQ